MTASQEKRTHAVLLLGHQNAGKTSLFNHLTNSAYQTVNYPGSTVDCAIGSLRDHGSTIGINIVDTPGITSLVPQSEDERITIRTLTSLQNLNTTFSPVPSSIVLVIDGTQLGCQLALFKQCQRIGIRPIVVLTMKDILSKRGASLNAKHLQRELGVPVIQLNNRTQDGLDRLIEAIKADCSIPKHPIQHLPEETNRKDVSDDFKWVEKTLSSSSTPTTSQNQGFDFDRLLLHPILGIFSFIVIMAGLFWTIFSLATPLMDMIDTFFAVLVTGVQDNLSPGLFRDLLSDGVITSLGATIIFIPQVAFLFFLIGLLESSGYLARGAALVDKPLSKIGLTGRSFVPLLSGNACAIPAMTATRSIPNKGERLATIFIIPLMLCSARLPVFGLFITLMLADKSKALAGLILTGIYFASLLIAAIVAKLISNIGPFKETSDGFVIRLPRLAMPMLKQVLAQTYYQTKKFIVNAGPTIFVVGMFLWVFSTFPNPDHSFSQMLGQWMDPIWQPMGVNWQVGVAILLSFAAREVFVSALAIMFAVQQDNQESIFYALSNATQPDGTPMFTVPVVLGLTVFFMISMQCLPTLAVAKREMGSWRLPMVMFVGYILLAYVLAILVYQSTRLFMG